MGPSKLAAIEISWLHFSNNRSSIQSFFEISGGEVKRPDVAEVERARIIIKKSDAQNRKVLY